MKERIKYLSIIYLIVALTCLMFVSFFGLITGAPMAAIWNGICAAEGIIVAFLIPGLGWVVVGKLAENHRELLELRKLKTMTGVNVGEES